MLILNEPLRYGDLVSTDFGVGFFTTVIGNTCSVLITKNIFKNIVKHVYDWEKISYRDELQIGTYVKYVHVDVNNRYNTSVKFSRIKCRSVYCTKSFVLDRFTYGDHYNENHLIPINIENIHNELPLEKDITNCFSDSSFFEILYCTCDLDELCKFVIKVFHHYRTIGFADDMQIKNNLFMFCSTLLSRFIVERTTPPKEMLEFICFLGNKKIVYNDLFRSR